ncbi:winged helix DNA-binding domain-containing protein [Aeromicrobium panaciterrae]|uniref:winged helix DNA-binding domain-containing protein n=1 Tax=Aeromicrobium panaciterrae TaxID=363861 RepID=UPI0031E46766
MRPSVVGRLHAQGLDAPRFDTAVDVVRHLGCVQSQLHDMGLWAVARRTYGLTKADLDAAFARGDFLRTHVLRPTWHFVDPSDLHWLLAVTAPRISKILMSGLNTIGLSRDQLGRGAEVIVDALADGVARTRAELGEALAGAGLAHAGQHLAHTVMHAEIEALIVNGPMRGKQHTYVLLDSVVTPPPAQPRDELLALIARRYARGHGPVRDKDLAWWTSLTLTESRRAIELGELRPIDIGGETYWSPDAPVESAPPVATLLSNFDEYISYARDTEDYTLFSGAPEAMMRSMGLLLVGGRLAGTWTRTIKSKTVDIVVDSSPRVTPPIRRALEAEAAAFGQFVERQPELQILG